MMKIVRIPEQRKGVLIGKNGSVKREIEKKTRTSVSVNNGIEIEGEALDIMKAEEIVTAIGRGFSPERAMKLMDEDYRLCVINLGGEGEKKIKRIFSRIIGREGKCRRRIEMGTKTDICVYGKTISIIGRWDSVEKAGGAIELLMKGKTHAYVYRCMEENK